MYIKTKPNISFSDFEKSVTPVNQFKGLRGQRYNVTRIDGTIMHFIRVSSGKPWNMDLQGVHKAYLKLIDFKTENFRPYVERTHSPALGLLLHIGLLK